MSLANGWLALCLRHLFFWTAVWYWVWVLAGTVALVIE